MAPVKRSTATTQRETRATRAATVAKKQSASLSKKSTDLPLAKLDTASTTSTTTARRGKRTVDEQQPDQTTSGQTEDVQDEEIVSDKPTKSRASRATRATAPSIGMAAAPRRRIKVTPLDKLVTDAAVNEDNPKPNRTRSKSASSTQKTSKKLNLETDESAAVALEEPPVQEPTAKSTRKSSSKSKNEPLSSEKKSAPKVRGRPKSQKTQSDDTKLETTEPTVSTRATRSQRAEIAAPPSTSVPDTETTGNPKSSKAPRKKVTFQDLTDEPDKENLPPLSKTRKGTAATTSENTPTTTGLRAKPLRKAVTTAASARVRKTSSATTRRQGKLATGDSETEKKISRVLTPKKIKQVARSSSPEQTEQELSDGEDELNGGKTPVRDLSVSPRRPNTAALARALSPVKRLDLGQSLTTKPLGKSAGSDETQKETSGLLGSPARRPDASPFKDALNGSPKRGLSEGAKLLFPHQNEQSLSIKANASTNSASLSLSTMLQSPKRIGVLDSTLFSQSVVNKAASKSPFKASLLGTPARRLFSPAKKIFNQPISEIQKQNAEDGPENDANEMEIESEVSASSHFRSSLSPLRVLRVEPSTAGFDFDDSILQVRSPLKITKSPPKIAFQPACDLLEGAEQSSVPPSKTMTNDDVETVEPMVLKIATDDVGGQENGVHQPEHRPDTPALKSEESFPATGALAGVSQPDTSRRSSLAQVLFRSNKAVSSDESSEDELAADETPMRPQALNRSFDTSARARPRMSTKASSNLSSHGYGLTPLAAQMSKWLASSPEKSPEQPQIQKIQSEISEFSPLARQHIEGEVMISRNSTPVAKLGQRKSMQPTLLPEEPQDQNRSSNIRKSFTQRQSLGSTSVFDSPARNQQFDEYMEIRAIEEQADADSTNANIDMDLNSPDFDEAMFGNEQPTSLKGGDDTILAEESDCSNDASISEAGDLTTDLIKFTHASDTAMIDFCKLAEEANEMASDGVDENTSDMVVIESDGIEAQNDDTPVQIAAIPIEEDELPVREEGQSDGMFFADELIDTAPSPVLKPVEESLTSPSMLVIERSDTVATSPSSIVYSSTESPSVTKIVRTPQPNLGLHDRRVINTVVSKVPLKPEGFVSPVKMPRKRSRSFGTSDGSPAKRISSEDLRFQSVIGTGEVEESPNRRIRTSVAPSPGGTSTPATAKSGAVRSDRYSLGAFSTPGQTSFALDDFGDSTLDVIELPEGFDDMTELATEHNNRDYALPATTPKAVSKATPTTAKRSARQPKTPITATKKTPKSVVRSSARVSKDADVERAPLEPVGKGVLHGAVVFVDVHTSEGADASGIFVELLNQMGAKCVREWRWNPRASVVPGVDNEVVEQRIGITHVVYKDGGRRTLEKVRDARGEVCCVGVAWVLDCERENKWLDESSYMIDANILPRGGSNRRKSMEPRALLVKNDGSVSTSKARRSVSAEMNELMKRELVSTPARNTPSPAMSSADDDGCNEDDENDVENQATPTGFVSYDPRTAMTPGTPYLVGQGKKLTQMSAPPKQHNKSLFADYDDEDEENMADDTFMEDEKEKRKTTTTGGDSGAVKDAKKFRMKNLREIAKRRKTLGWKPAIGSPLGR